MSEITFRPATTADLPAIVSMLADDHLGAQRESPDNLAPYERALAEISADPRLLQVICERDGAIVGTMQLTLIPGLSRKGKTRLQIEGVRVHANHRSGAIGGEMIRWAITYGRDHGCGLVELTTDKSRADAHRFYERLGFVQSHYGYKLKLM
jgi:GNAT superfamily N-acetyltransferase